MNLNAPLTPSTPITAAVYNEANRLFGDGENRVAAYAYLYKETGNLAFLVSANPNLTHPAKPILTRGWMPTVCGSAVDKCRSMAVS
jgi:hypothetical protein